MEKLVGKALSYTKAEIKKMTNPMQENWAARIADVPIQLKHIYSPNELDSIQSNPQLLKQIQNTILNTFNNELMKKKTKFCVLNCPQLIVPPIDKTKISNLLSKQGTYWKVIELQMYYLIFNIEDNKAPHILLNKETGCNESLICDLEIKDNLYVINGFYEDLIQEYEIMCNT